jgi:hypothetical protein
LEAIAMFSGGLSLTRVRNNAFREARETVIDDNELGKALYSSRIEVAERDL